MPYFTTPGADFRTRKTCYKRAIEITELNLGRQHPNVATELNNPAGLYKTMGTYDKAQALYERVLEIRKLNFGPRHSSVATVLKNLRKLNERMENVEQANSRMKKMRHGQKKR